MFDYASGLANDEIMDDIETKFQEAKTAYQQQGGKLNEFLKAIWPPQPERLPRPTTAAEAILKVSGGLTHLYTRAPMGCPDEIVATGWADDLAVMVGLRLACGTPVLLLQGCRPRDSINP